MTTQTDTTYNGWKNYPTWNVALWIGNEEPLYRTAREMAQMARDDAPESSQVLDGIWTEEQATRFNLADALENWVREELAHLLGHALDEVDWHEIADAQLED